MSRLEHQMIARLLEKYQESALNKCYDYHKLLQAINMICAMYPELEFNRQTIRFIRNTETKNYEKALKKYKRSEKGWQVKVKSYLYKINKPLDINFQSIDNQLFSKVIIPYKRKRYKEKAEEEEFEVPTVPYYINIGELRSAY